ncbi:MAG: hypothetical protein B6D36_03215 [Planctomycetes bacterium UTPLA1]|jgi:hypothetical protein|nr:MAG: hypothetical protein B6D36_03215 [Planctomycetes bacterium UTPLA1]
MEQKNVTQAGVGRELELQLSDAADSERNPIYLPSLPGLARVGLPRFDFSELMKGGDQHMTIETLSIDERVNHYVRLFETIRNKVGDDQLAAIILEQCGKDARVAQMRGFDQRSDNGSARGDTSATPKQLAFLEKLQVKYIPQNLTRMKASQMIDEAQSRMVAA